MTRAEQAAELHALALAIPILERNEQATLLPAAAYRRLRELVRELTASDPVAF